MSFALGNKSVLIKLSRKKKVDRVTSSVRWSLSWKSAFVRSRAKVTEADEKNSLYFSKLEKKTEQSIEEDVFSFYSKLYFSNYS